MNAADLPARVRGGRLRDHDLLVRLAAFVIVMGLAIAARWLAPATGLGGPSAALAFGFALVAAAIAGDLVDRVRLPRVTGYLLFGLVCGPYVANILSRPMARQLELANGLAVALIAFISGLEMNFSRLWPRLGTILRVGGATIGITWLGLFALLLAAWDWLPILPEASGFGRVAVVALVATLVTSFSPTVTLAVLADSRARGPFSELVLTVAVLGDLVLILTFALAMEAVRWTIGGAGLSDVGLLAQLAWEIFGSLAFGGLVGSAFALYLRGIGRETTVVLVGVCTVLAVLSVRLHFEPVLAALAAGLVVENIAAPRGDALRQAVENGSAPVLIILFVAAGAALDLGALAAFGAPALVLAAARTGLVRVGNGVGVNVSRPESDSGSLLWMGLISQAGVTLGLAFLVAAEYPDWGLRVRTLIVAMVALHQIVGPVAFRLALARTGEIGRMDDEAEASAATG